MVDITTQGIMIKLNGPNGIKRGDGVVFDRGQPEEDEDGGSIYEIFKNGKSVGMKKTENEKVGKNRENNGGNDENNNGEIHDLFENFHIICNLQLVCEKV